LLPFYDKYVVVPADTASNNIVFPFYDKHVVVHAYTASNNIVFVCKKYNHGCLINEVCISKNFAVANPTYKILFLIRKKFTIKTVKKYIFIDSKEVYKCCIQTSYAMNIA
jgi:hypothetical protein